MNRVYIDYIKIGFDIHKASDTFAFLPKKADLKWSGDPMTDIQEEIIEDNIVDNGEDVAVEEIVSDEIVNQINTRRTYNRTIIRVLKKFRKINKYMMGGRNFTEDDIVLDDDGKEVESVASKGDNMWPSLELVVNVTGELEKMLVIASLEELTRNDPTWVYMANEPIMIMKRVKEWMIRNHKTIMMGFETGCLIDAIEFCKVQDEKWGRWKYLSYNSESTLPEYHEKMISQVAEVQAVVENNDVDKGEIPS